MFEMLGNQLFLVRNYARAAEMLQKALWKDPGNKAIRRKLIVCLTQTGEVERALEIFHSLCKEDIDYIINTDPVDDDCPCSELVFNLEEKFSQNQNSLDFNLISGMLWLYCDIKRSLEFFERAHQLAPEKDRIKGILSLIRSRMERNERARSG